MGWFRFYFDEQRWEWSEQVQRLHGYLPGTVRPTTDLVLSHKHPDDRSKVAATIENVVHGRAAFSGRHRLIDTAGIVHSVVVVGDQLVDDDGRIIGTHGFYVEVAPTEVARAEIDREQQVAITARVAEIADNRGPIEQAKGMLMLIYDLDADTAFSLLKWLSQENNVKLRLLAEQILTDFRPLGQVAGIQHASFDQALMTAHQHISDSDKTTPT
ncbi:MAG: hypothetical protein QOK02_4124 [Mycobacterium sp.]|nr:hypothetical protein [Mycobacterium sp.]